MRLVRDYHGGFRHPMRAFLIGTAVILLTLSGFALAAGVSSGRSVNQLVITRTNGKVRVVTEEQPVLTTVVSGSVQTITLPGTTGQVVVVRIHGKRSVRIVRVPASSAATQTVAPQGAASPLPPPADTVTETVYDPVTVTGPGSTVTETITEPPVTVTDTTSTSSGSTP